MIIKVTQDDIDKGQPYNCNRCPIALALMRELKINEVEVDGSKADYIVTINNERIWYGIELPQDAFNFVMRFDEGENVGPIAFEATPRERTAENYSNWRD